jgi:hypothetical protein
MTSLSTRLSIAGLVAVVALSLGACQRRDETPPAGGATGPDTSSTTPGGSGMGSGTATAPDAAASAASNP